MPLEPMRDDEVLGLVQAEYAAAELWSEELASEREKALDYYYGKPLGNEEEGHSQAVSSDVADVVEWLMPGLIRTFAGDEELIAFEPTGHDEKQAKLATKLAQHVLFVDNDGFRLIHDAIKDGLLSKVGAMKWVWCEKQEPIDRDYQGLDELELTLLLQRLQAEGGDGVSIIGQEVVPQDDGSARFNVRVRVLRKWGQVEVETVPPEELLVPRSARVIDDTCRYVAHDIKGKTRSDLVAMGIDLETVLDLPKADDDWNDIKASRFGGFYGQEAPIQNVMMEPVEYVEHYVLADVDGDGIAERRLICTSGEKILRNEVLAGLPIAAWSPVRVPHAAVGRSIADRILDIQRVMTALLRGTLDNIYTVNAGGRYEAVQGQVNMDDLLTMRPGGIVRVKAAGMLRQLPTEYIGTQTMQVMQMVRTMREERTGVNSHTQGLNAETLHQTASGAMAVMQQGAELQELIARLFGEFCLKRVFRGIFDLVVRYQNDQRQIRVAGEVLTIDPGAFTERFNLRVKVGAGNPRRAERKAALANILSSQAEALKAGLPIVGIKQLYQATVDMTELEGFMPGRYWIDPASPEGQALAKPKEPQQNPLVEAEVVKGKVRMAENEQKDAFARQERAVDHAEKMTELSLQHGIVLPGSVL